MYYYYYEYCKKETHTRVLFPSIQLDDCDSQSNALRHTKGAWVVAVVEDDVCWEGDLMLWLEYFGLVKPYSEYLGRYLIYQGYSRIVG